MTIDRKDHYLGVHGTPEGRLRYERLITAWMQVEPVPARESESSTDITAAEVCIQYLRWAEGHYINLATSLSSAGVATLPAQAGGTQGLYAPSTASQNSQLTQLNTDIQKLQTENQTLAAKSLVTVSDLTNLVTDGQTIAGAGLRLDPQNLDKVVNELVTAVVAGTDTTPAKTDFNALSTGSNVAQTSIDKTFNDLVQTIQDSKITPADLTTLAADQAAIQTDRTNLLNGSGTSVTNSTGSAGSGTSGGSGTTGSTGGPVTHFARLRGFRGFSRVRLR